MTLSINEDSDKLILEITAFQYYDNNQVKSVTMNLAKDDIDYLQDVGIYVPSVVLEELIRELYECNTDEDYENALSYFDENELNELLNQLDIKFKNLWNGE